VIKTLRIDRERFFICYTKSTFSTNIIYEFADPRIQAQRIIPEFEQKVPATIWEKTVIPVTP
jgi:hypothetical protein